MSTRAQWAKDIPDLYDNGELATATNYYPVTAVSELTGLATTTILDLLSRKPITSPTNALAPICRPAARIANQPLYSVKQVNEVIERQRAIGHRHLGGGTEPLPRVSPEEARQRGLLSVTELAELGEIHEQTIRRWARDRQDFPRPVAMRSRESGHAGVPIVVWERRVVLDWFTSHGHLDLPATGSLEATSKAS